MATGGSQPKRNVTRVGPTEPTPKEDRDPNRLNKHIIVDFYSILGEPTQEGTRSVDCIWEFSEVMYDCFLNCCYNMFALFCGVCIAIYWGCAFVPTLFSNIWIFTPFRACLQVILGDWGRKCCLLFANLCIRPYTLACSGLFRHFGDGTNRRPPTPQLFPDRKPRAKPPPKPKTPPPPVVEKKEPDVVVSKHRQAFDEYDKERIAKSVRRQMML